MAKYTELAEDILKHVDGKENINSLKHCVTRLRFDLKDESKADDDYLKNRDGVVTVVKAGGQYQVVIGNHVPDVYAEVLQVGGLPAGGSLDIDEGDAPKGNLFDRFVSLYLWFQVFSNLSLGLWLQRDYQRNSRCHGSMWPVSCNKPYVCNLECSRRWFLPVLANLDCLDICSSFQG